MHEPQIIMETGSTQLLTHEGVGALAYKIRGMVPPAQYADQPRPTPRLEAAVGDRQKLHGGIKAAQLRPSPPARGVRSCTAKSRTSGRDPAPRAHPSAPAERGRRPRCAVIRGRYGREAWLR